MEKDKINGMVINFSISNSSYLQKSSGGTYSFTSRHNIQN